jgi:hypothetical protein
MSYIEETEADIAEMKRLEVEKGKKKQFWLLLRKQTEAMKKNFQNI